MSVLRMAFEVEPVGDREAEGIRGGPESARSAGGMCIPAYGGTALIHFGSRDFTTGYHVPDSCTRNPLRPETDEYMIVRWLHSFDYTFYHLERWTSRVLKDIENNANVSGSDVLSGFDPSELTFT